MARREESIHVLEELSKCGDGNLFLGTVNTVVTSYADRTAFKHVGATKDGFEFTPIKELDEKKVGTPLRLADLEVIEKGYELKFFFAEPLPADQWYFAMGHGTISSVEAGASTTITDHAFTLYGHNWQQLPYHDLTITSITDSGATPTTYSGADITTNFDLDLNLGRIKLKEASAITSAKYGANYTFSGTWNKPLESTWVDDANQSSENYYSVRFLANKESRRTKGFFIPKASFTVIDMIPFKANEQRVIGVTLRSLRDPSMAYEFMLLDEKSS